MDNNKTEVENSSLDIADSPATTAIVSGESETSTSLTSTSDTGTTNTGVVSPDAVKAAYTSKKVSLLHKIFDKFNLYLILLFAVLLILGGISYYSIDQSHKNAKDNAIKTQKLTTESLSKLSGTDSKVGDATQTLTVESNAIFNGGVLVSGSLDVAGSLKIGAALTLPSLTVGGKTTVEQLAAKSLTVAGDTAIQGKVTGQNGLAITGSGSFSGLLTASQVSADKLVISGDLQINRHIDPSGGAPGRTNGSALGSGGTASNSGTDTAGTITINTGNSAPAGCFINISFAAPFGAVPHVVISPSSSSAAAIDYYATRTTTGFSVCTASDPPDNASGIIFDYIAID